MAPEQQFFTPKFGCCGVLLRVLVSEQSFSYFIAFKYFVVLHIHNMCNYMLRIYIHYIKAHHVCIFNMVSKQSNSSGNSNPIISLFSNTACLAVDFLQYCSQQGKAGKFTGTHVQDCVWATSPWILPLAANQINLLRGSYWQALLTQPLELNPFQTLLEMRTATGKQNHETNPTEHSSSPQYYQNRINDTFPLQPSSISYLTNGNISNIGTWFLFGIVFTGHN